MHGDFSRGHRPDRQRNQTYLRAFAQERRLLLDSDLNAATDALHERLRGLANHLGCPKGSPDLGYLVTPGRLLALFRDLDSVVVSSVNMTFHRDYMMKYLNRYPSLHLLADQGGAGTITLRLRQPANGDVRVWCRRDAAAVVTFGGVAVAVPATADLTAAPNINFGNLQQVDVTLAAGGEIWIGLVESFHAATLAPHFGYASGHYYLDGLPLENPADATWASTNPADVNNPNAPFPVGAGTLAVDNRLLVYLEGWERHVTAVEDLGLLERALGGDTDTMTRGRAVGQVKLALVPAAFDQALFDRALASPIVTDGTLALAAPLPDPDPNPCALPVQAGYTGLDNRLYRFEVHVGGATGAATIKWSRDNGCELFHAINAASDNELTFPSTTPLQGGDLVEIVTADSIELGDAQPALLDAAAGTFTPAERSVGALARLVGPTANGGATFTLIDPIGGGVFHLPAHFGGFPIDTLKVRRWHGLIDTAAEPDPANVSIENGIRVALNGSYTPRDYWQLEVRAAGNNDNGPFQPLPHGPERDFAPLALLRFTAVGQPLVLERWLDDRFVPICELTADDIAFDGGHIGSDSDTVQEIIEEIYERLGGGCCEVTLEPAPGDAAVPIRTVLDDSQGEVTICFSPGIYTFTSRLDINNRTVILKGCPRAVFVGDGPTRIFNVIGTGRLVLDHLVVFSRQADGTRVLIDVAAGSHGVEVRETALILLPTAAAGPPAIAIRVEDEEPPAFDPALSNPPAPAGGMGAGPPVRLHQALVVAEWGLSGARLDRLIVNESAFECEVGCIWAGRGAMINIRSSGLVAGVSLAAAAAWTPQALLSQRADLFVALGDLDVPGVFPAPNSVGIWMSEINAGTVIDCGLVAGVGFACSDAGYLNLSHCHCQVSRIGVHLAGTDNSLIEGLVLNSNGGTTGVAVGRATSLRITGCNGRLFQVGAGLAVLASVTPRDLTNVQLEGNRFSGVQLGVQVGAASSGVYAGRLTNVSIADNTVVSANVGIAVNTLTIGNGQFLPAVAVRVAGNMVTARYGIGVIGSDVEVTGNQVRRTAPNAPFLGILGVNTTGFCCRANHIESAINPINVANPQNPDAAFMSLNTASVQPSAIVLSGGSGATVAGNVTHADAGLRLRSLSADNHGRLSVKGNEFLSGEVTCQNTDEIVFLDNTVAGLARISGSEGGQADDNRVFANELMKLEGDLDILTATGRWKVSDNRADGAIRVVPTSIGTVFPGWFDRGFYNVGDFRALDNLAVLAGNREFGNLIRHQPGTPPVVPPGGTGEPAPDVAPMAREAGRASYAMSNPAWREDYTRGIVTFIGAGANEALIDVIRDVGDIIIINGQREGAYQVQCTANWSRDLQVGIATTNVRINATSTVQVVANRADNEMAVKSYTRLVMALNVAADYPLAGNSQALAINQLNLEI